METIEPTSSTARAALDRGLDVVERFFGVELARELVSQGRQVDLVAANNVRTASDCTGHAEMVAVRNAQKQWGRAQLRGATMYASGEPCAMCAGALFWACVSRIVFAAS